LSVLVRFFSAASGELIAVTKEHKLKLQETWKPADHSRMELKRNSYQPHDGASAGR
jgi:hypothetical protein